MARLDKAEDILEAARRWHDTCLVDNGSILTDEALWTPENLDELDRYYVQRPDVGEGSFFEKLEEQLRPASPGAKKLAAEMFWFMYLMVAEIAISAETKRFQIRKVWEWSGEEFPDDHWAVGDVLSKGVAHTGTGYNAHRWREFRFFVTMMQDWKALDRDQRLELLDDPWDFARWVEAREYAPARQLRHIILFLLFPDHFERIATASHKRKIVRTFRSRWDEDPEKVDYSDRIALDREVLRIREKLPDEIQVDGEVDFYYEPITHIWRDSSPDTSDGDDQESFQRGEDPERWLEERFGDAGIWLISPGQGARLWRDFMEDGLIAIGWDYLGDLAEYSSRDDVHEAISEREGRENPRNDSLAVWQFHQEIEPGDVVIAKQGRSRLLGWGEVTDDYTYEAERGEYQHIRPVDWKRTGKWEIPSERARAIKTLTDVRDDAPWVRWAFDVMEGREPARPDGERGERYPVSRALEDLFLEPEEFTEILDSLARRRNAILQGPPGVGKTFMARRLAFAHIGWLEPERVEFVQFHQSYAYEDFIQGWRPTAEGGFVLQDGVFHSFCAKAADAPEIPHVFIIDEINRGNLSRIFGELMMLVEGDKRGPKHAIPLTYSPDDSFYVPENVFLIGLMNTADRSLAMVDYALRRRFGFVTLEPAFGGERFTAYLLQAGVPSKIVDRINDRMSALNETIRNDRRNLGPGFEIGHSYFVPSGDEAALDESWYESVIRTEVAPLLREYWFDQPREVDEHVGRLLA